MACQPLDRRAVPTSGLAASAYENELKAVLATDRPPGYVFGSHLVVVEPGLVRRKRRGDASDDDSNIVDETGARLALFTKKKRLRRVVPVVVPLPPGPPPIADADSLLAVVAPLPLPPTVIDIVVAPDPHTPAPIADAEPRSFEVMRPCIAHPGFDPPGLFFCWCLWSAVAAHRQRNLSISRGLVGTWVAANHSTH
jgi:hypothetical protein